MGVSKEAMLDAFGRFKQLQDEANDEKFVAKEAGKSLISDDDLAKLRSLDTSGYVTTAQMQTAVSALASIFGGTLPDSGDSGVDTGGGSSGGDTIYVTDPDEEISDEELQNLFH